MRAPLGSLRRQAPSEPELRRKAHLTVHRPSACSGVKALRNTSDARAASRQAALAFRSLDPFRALREPDRRRRDEERLSRSEQRTVSKNPQNNLLTGKAPYKSAAEPNSFRSGREPSVPRRESVGLCCVEFEPWDSVPCRAVATSGECSRRKFGGIGIDPDIDPPLVGGNVIDAVRRHLTQASLRIATGTRIMPGSHYGSVSAWQLSLAYSAAAGARAHGLLRHRE